MQQCRLTRAPARSRIVYGEQLAYVLSQRIILYQRYFFWKKAPSNAFLAPLLFQRAARLGGAATAVFREGRREETHRRGRGNPRRHVPRRLGGWKKARRRESTVFRHALVRRFVRHAGRGRDRDRDRGDPEGFFFAIFFLLGQKVSGGKRRGVVGIKNGRHRRRKKKRGWVLGRG